MSCAHCGKPLDQHEAHRFEEVIEGREREYSLCGKCCPNCFGGVGGTKDYPITWKGKR